MTEATSNEIDLVCDMAQLAIDRQSTPRSTLGVTTRDRFTTLPEELIEQICRSLLDSRTRDNALLIALCSLCRTSKALDRIARKFLYHDVELRWNEVIKFTKTILKYPELANLVHSALIQFSPGESTYDQDDFLYFQTYVRSQGVHHQEKLESLVRHGQKTVSEIFWIVVVEVLLLHLNTLKSLHLRMETNSGIVLFDSLRFKKHPDFLLPALTDLTYHAVEHRDTVRAVQMIVSRCNLEEMRVVRCDDMFYPLSGPSETERSCRSLRRVSFVDCPYLEPWMFRRLADTCPNLEVFNYMSEGSDDEDMDMYEDRDETTASDVVKGLEPIRKTLKSLSITTDSLGDDDGFPSLARFTTLEHLRVDAYDLADYDEDDEESDSEESDEGEDEDIVEELTEDTETTDEWVDEDDVDSDTINSSDSNTPIEFDDSDSSASTSDTCKPILHLLPRSLKTLWIDNLAGLDGGLDDELLKLASTAKEDFPSLERFTTEGDKGEFEKLEKAFKKAGIEFIVKPCGHFWFVEEGLDRFNED